MKLLATLGLAAALLVAGPPDAPVADAAMRGDVPTVRSLLEGGADVNAAQGDGMTALHWAADNGNASLASLLIYAGANLEAATRIGHYTPLHVASRAGHADVVKALLAAGAKVDARSTSGATPLHLAAAAGDDQAVGLLLDAGADPNARESRWGQTPLIFAASWNRAAAIKRLLSGGADPSLASTTVNVEDQSKIYGAADKARDAVLKQLTGGKRPPTPEELAQAVDAARDVIRAGKVPPENKNDPRARFRGDPRILTKGGLTPLLHAVRQGNEAAVEALLDGGADINQVDDGDGTSPLLMAAINGQFDVAVLLLKRGANPNLASTLNGVTPLWATINSEWQPRTRYPQPQEQELQKVTYLDVMKALLEAGADPDVRIKMHPWYMEYTGCGNGNCGLIDMNGATAFLRAAYATDVDAMKLLVQYGADPNIPTRAPAPRQRRTPDEFLRQQALAQLTSGFDALDASAKVKALAAVRDGLPDELQDGFDDDALKADPDGMKNALLEASKKAEAMKEDETDPSGLPPVPEGGPGVFPIHAASGVGYGEGFAGNAHRHVPDGWMPAVKYLVEELGADVNARDFNGYTPLHHAASRGDDEMIQYLVDHGADVSVVSRRGQTTADMANGPVQRVSPFPATVQLLEKLGSKNNHNCLTC